MSMPSVEVVDLHNDNKKVNLEDLTQTALGMLIHECNVLREQLMDMEAQTND